jgi:hypothetical protein
MNGGTMARDLHLSRTEGATMKHNGVELVKRIFEYSTWLEMLVVRVLLWLIFGAGIYFIAGHIH